MITNEQNEKQIIDNIINGDLGLSVYEEQSQIIFRIDNKIFTDDYMEALSYLMRRNKPLNKELLNLDVSKNENVNAINALYWLSGGDHVWDNPNLNLSWKDEFEELLEEFSDIIYECAKGNTLEDIKNNIKQKLNLDVFYEYFLKRNLI